MGADDRIGGDGPGVELEHLAVGGLDGAVFELKSDRIVESFESEGCIDADPHEIAALIVHLFEIGVNLPDFRTREENRVPRLT